jgi:hypothetical protein
MQCACVSVVKFIFEKMQMFWTLIFWVMTPYFGGTNTSLFRIEMDFQP